MGQGRQGWSKLIRKQCFLAAGSELGWAGVGGVLWCSMGQPRARKC